MITAAPLPMKVGVAPGTTTFTLGNPACDRGARALAQRIRNFFKRRLVTEADLTVPVVRRWTRPVPTVSPTTAVQPSTARSAAQNAMTRLRTAFSPYANPEEFRGGLGYILTPAGDNSPAPYAEIVASMKNAIWQKDAHCGTYDAQYHTRGEPGMYYDSPLGAIPSDLQLARIRGYTPVMSSWASFNQQSWAPLPWAPRIGTWTPEGLRPVGPVLRGAEDMATQAAEDAAPFDPGRAAVSELKRHQDRVFALSIVSTMAIASTAAINIIQHLRNRKKASKQYEPASPTAPVSGLGRSRRRRGRR